MRPPSLEVSTQIPQLVLETFRGKTKKQVLKASAILNKMDPC